MVKEVNVMNCRVVIHSIDLQDRKGFLAFLGAHAREGYEAVRIFRSFTVFRKTETPPSGYSMYFLPEGDRRSASVPPIPGLKNDVVIFPVPGEDDTRWAEKVSARYTDFVPYDLLHAVTVAVKQLVLPLALLMLLLLRGAATIRVSEDLLFLGLGLLTALWAVVVIGTEVLAFFVDTLHLRGLRQEAKTGQPYRIPAAQQRLIRVKNLCVMLDWLPSVVLVLVLLLVWMQI